MTPMPFRFVLLTGLVASTALAIPLKKGIGSAKEDECPELPKPAAAQSGRDVALTRAVLWAFEPAPTEVRTQAIEDLGLLGDTRALNALAQLSLDPNPAYARAAVRAIGAIRHARAEEILSNIIRHPTIAEATKMAALEALPFQNTWSAMRFVHNSARSSATPYNLAAIARRLSAELPQPPPFTPASAPPAAAPVVVPPAAGGRP